MWLLKRGYNVEIYFEPNNNYEEKSLPEAHKAIWLGRNIPLEFAKEIIKLALKAFPFLRYIKLNQDWEHEEDYVYIGGATTTAIRYKLKPVDPNQFAYIQSISTIEELHSYIKSFE